MSSIKWFRVLAPLLGFFGLAAPAAAYVPPPINIAAPFSTAKMQKNLLDRRQGQKATSNALTAPNAPALTAPATTYESSDFTYRPDAARTQANLKKFIERTPNPKGKAELQKLISAQPTIVDDIGNAIRPYGMDPHNVADAYAMWWMNAWLASERRNDDPDRTTIEAVKQQVYAAFAATPDFAGTSDAQRQEYAEALMVQAMIIGSIAEAAEGNPALQEQLAQTARQGAKDSSLDLSLMTLTPQGFAPRQIGQAGLGATGDAKLTRISAEGDAVPLEDKDPGLPPFNIVLISGMGLAAVALGATYFVRRG